MTRDGQKTRTRRDLVEAALGLIAAGSTPTVTQVADAAGVSRRTAYRYFPSAEQLITDALLEQARSGVESEINGDASDETRSEDIATRVDRLVHALNDLTINNEHLLRQMVRFTVDRGQIEPGLPPRPSRRLDYVEQAISPLQGQLDAADYERLLRSLAVVIGIEARIVLSDICGLDDAQILDTARWAAQALLTAALRPPPDPPR